MRKIRPDQKKVLDSGWGVCYNLQGYDGIKRIFRVNTCVDRQAGARWSPERMKHMEATYKKPDAQLFITTKTRR